MQRFVWINDDPPGSAPAWLRGMTSVLTSLMGRNPPEKGEVGKTVICSSYERGKPRPGCLGQNYVPTADDLFTNGNLRQTCSACRGYRLRENEAKEKKKLEKDVEELAQKLAASELREAQLKQENAQMLENLDGVSMTVKSAVASTSGSKEEEGEESEEESDDSASAECDKCGATVLRRDMPADMSCPVCAKQ